MRVTLIHLFCFALACSLFVAADAKEAPKVLSDYLKADFTTRAELVAVVPPEELQKYTDKVRESAKKNPEWFKEYSKKIKDGIPLPYDDQLGLTKEEYAEYLSLWGKREMKPLPLGEVTLRLESPKEGNWVIRATGKASPLSLIRYQAKDDLMKSPNGPMKRLPDIDADEQSVLGKWTGHEWKFEEEGVLGKVKENLAIGKTGDGKYGLLVYRLQEVSSEGKPIYDRRFLIRFPMAVK